MITKINNIKSIITWSNSDKSIIEFKNHDILEPLIKFLDKQNRTDHIFWYDSVILYS